MKKVALFTAVGLVLIIGGIVLFYLYLTSLDSGNNLVFFGLSILMAGGGAYCLILASKPASKKEADNLSLSNGGGTSLLEKNNEMLGDYAKTANARDRLKVLETAQENEVL
jgi:hypothetical protein